SNLAAASHAWAKAGSYPVILRAYNETYAQGVSTTVLVHVVEGPIHYVALNSSNPLPPYGSWQTAAADIQAAVDVAALPGALILVSNGLYQTGGRLISYGAVSNR